MSCSEGSAYTALPFLLSFDAQRRAACSEQTSLAMLAQAGTYWVLEITVNGMSPSVTPTSVSVMTRQWSVYLPGGNVGARANKTSGAESRRG